MRKLFDNENGYIFWIIPWSGWKNECQSLLFWLAIYLSGYVFIWLYERLCCLCNWSSKEIIMNPFKNYWQRLCEKMEKETIGKLLFSVSIKAYFVSLAVAYLIVQIQPPKEWISFILWPTITITSLWSALNVIAFEKTHPKKQNQDQ